MQTKLLMEFKKNQDEQFEKQKALEFQLQDREDARFLRELHASNRKNIQNRVIISTVPTHPYQRHESRIRYGKICCI
jgi:hypothetical protein